MLFRNPGVKIAAALSVTLAPAQQVTGIAITLLPGVGSITGTVTTPTGAAVGGVTVTASDGSLTVTTATLSLGQPGTYTLSGLPVPGTYTVTFEVASPYGVTDGFHIANSSGTNLSGSVNIPSTGGWQTYTWVPLKDSGGNPVQIASTGSVETMRVTTDNGNYNANFYILVPVYTPPSGMALSISRSSGNGNLSISFPTQPGYNYQLEYKTNLTDAVWIPLGNTTVGDGTIHLLTDVIGKGSRFYRVNIQ